jgi:ABC-type branched-subunit amino acid transport system substrate-binding protein
MKSLSIRCVLVGLLLLAGGCGDGSRADDGAPRVGPPGTVYVELPFSGPTRADALSMLAAVRLVVEQSGSRVVIKRLDDVRGDLGRCRANAQRALADSTAIAVIGTYDSDCTAVVHDVLARSEIAVVSPVNSANDLDGVVRIAPTAEDEARGVIAAAQSLKPERLLLAEGWRGAGGEIQELLVRSPLKAVAASVVRAPSLARRGDLIAGVGLSPVQVAGLLVAIRPIGARVLLPSSSAVPATLLLRGAESALVLSRFVPASSLSGRGASFADAFAKRYGEPRDYDLYAADAMIAIDTALSAGGGIAIGLKERLASLVNVPGVTRTFSVQPDGRTSPQPMAVLAIDRGGFRVDRVVSYALS